jgi:predicted RNase H-like HicB family nuclease
MLLHYIQTAMHDSRYELLDEGEGFYGEIPECRGVFANAATLDACREQLAEVLGDWIMLRLARALPLPAIDGVELWVREVA